MWIELLKDYRLILGSNSPRRKKILEDMGIPFTKIIKEVEEVFPETLKHHQITDYLARLKAEPFKEALAPNDILFTCDTIVWHEGRMLGKPKTKKEAVLMLDALSGQSHEVISSICFSNQNFQVVEHAVTKVYFNNLSDYLIEYYIDKFKPFDKAGGYGIQELIGMIGIKKIEGSYENVVGLPTELFYTTLSTIIRS